MKTGILVLLLIFIVNTKSSSIIVPPISKMAKQQKDTIRRESQNRHQKNLKETNIRLNQLLEDANQRIESLEDSVEYLQSMTEEFAYPIYERSFADSTGKWIEGIVVLGMDTFDLKAKINNKYKFEKGRVSINWLKAYKYTSVQNLNPFTETNSVMAFDVEKPKIKTFYKYLGIGLAAFLLGIVIGR